MAAVANEHCLKNFNLGVAQSFLRAKHGHELYMNLPDGWCNVCAKTVPLTRSPYGLGQRERQKGELLMETVRTNCRSCRLHYDSTLGRKMKRTPCRVVYKFPINTLGQLTWCTRSAFIRDWQLGTLEITQKAFIESTFNCV